MLAGDPVSGLVQLEEFGRGDPAFSHPPLGILGSDIATGPARPSLPEYISDPVANPDALHPVARRNHIPDAVRDGIDRSHTSDRGRIIAPCA
jgi:hypothetical protein